MVSVDPDNGIVVWAMKDHAANKGDDVRVDSRRGSAQGIVRLTNKMLAGNVYMNMHYGRLLDVGEGRLAN